MVAAVIAKRSSATTTVVASAKEGERGVAHGAVVGEFPLAVVAGGRADDLFELVKGLELALQRALLGAFVAESRQRVVDLGAARADFGLVEEDFSLNLFGVFIWVLRLFRRRQLQLFRERRLVPRVVSR